MPMALDQESQFTSFSLMHSFAQDHRALRLVIAGLWLWTNGSMTPGSWHWPAAGPGRAFLDCKGVLGRCMISTRQVNQPIRQRNHKNCEHVNEDRGASRNTIKNEERQRRGKWCSFTDWLKKKISRKNFLKQQQKDQTLLMNNLCS